MNKEQKLQKKKERGYNRIAKRIAKDKEYLNKGFYYNEGIGFGRRVSNGSQFICDMRYSSCELRRSCNGDC